MEMREFHGRYFPLGSELLQWMLAAHEEGLDLPIRFFRDATVKHPDKALAWHGLFTALSLCGEKSKAVADEVTSAMARALELGSGYFERTDQGVRLLMLGNEPDHS